MGIIVGRDRQRLNLFNPQSFQGASGILSSLLWRAVVAVVVVGAVVYAARRQRTLSPSGAAAGFGVGVLCTMAGVGWGVLLITLFITANLLSRYRHSVKEARIGDLVEKGGERDAWQVAANGGTFTALAVASLVHPSWIWFPLGAGAIAAATADTWATEIGTLASHSPRLITTGKVVPAGTSGAVTWIGTFAGLAGAIFIGVIALIVGWGRAAAYAGVAGGIAGSLVDSLAGATIQRRRWCDVCNRPTERRVHSCGTTTHSHGGIGWVDNDVVNAISSLTGAVVGSIWLW